MKEETALPYFADVEGAQADKIAVSMSTSKLFGSFSDVDSPPEWSPFEAFLHCRPAKISVRVFDRKASVHQEGKDIAVVPVFKIQVFAIYRQGFYTTKYKQRISPKSLPRQDFLQTSSKRTDNTLCVGITQKREATALVSEILHNRYPCHCENDVLIAQQVHHSPQDVILCSIACPACHKGSTYSSVIRPEGEVRIVHVSGHKHIGGEEHGNHFCSPNIASVHFPTILQFPC
jgi:hypothetical protein